MSVPSLSLVILFSVVLDDGIVNSGLMGGKGKCRDYEPWGDQSGNQQKNLKKWFEAQFMECFSTNKKGYKMLHF